MEKIFRLYKNKKKSIMNSIYEFASVFAVLMPILAFAFYFIFGLVSVDGKSMENTLKNEDKLVILKSAYKPEYGDIVIVSRNYVNEEDVPGDPPIIKRVIATEGQTVKIEDGFVYVDSVKLDEPYTKAETFLNERSVEFPLIVESGKVIVMGDNRTNSRDSRDIGQVDTRFIIGKVLVRFYPFDKIGKP